MLMRNSVEAFKHDGNEIGRGVTPVFVTFLLVLTHAFIGQDSIVPRIGSTTGIDARGLASLIGTRSTLEDTVSSTRVRTRLSVVGTHSYLR